MSFPIPSKTTLPLLSALLLAVTTSYLRGEQAATPAWEQAGWGGGGYFYCAAYHPAQDGVIYMGGDVGGAYKTEDHGLHWRTINNGLASYGVFSLAVDRSNPQTVYAATEGGLCKSTDAGEHWQKLPQTGKKELHITGEKGKSIRSVAVDPTNGNIVYAASPAGKVYKSTDGGQTWAVSYEKKAAGEEPGVLRVQYGKVNSAFFGDIWLPVVFPSDAKASDCIGIGFTLKGDGSLPKDSFLILKTKNGTTYRSKNLNTLYQDTEWRDIVLKAGDFVLDPDFVKKNPDAAASASAVPDWSSVVRLDLPCSGPLPTTPVVSRLKKFHFAFAPAKAGGEPRLVPIVDFATPDVAKALQTAGNIRIGPPAGEPILSVAVAPSDPSRVIAATSSSGLVLSLDSGKTWKELDTPKKAASATFDHSDPNVIYGAFFADGIFKSADGGSTWAKISGSFPDKTEILEVAVSSANPLDLYAIGKVGWTGLFAFSNDGGETWQSQTKKLEGGAIWGYPTNLYVDAASGNPSLDGLYNKGTTALLSAPTNITINPTDPKEIFVSANWRSILSKDGGHSWTERDRGADISCITDIRFLNGKTYTTAMDEGSFVSDNNGATWRELWPLKHVDDLSGHNWRIAVNEINGAERIIATASPWTATPDRVIRSDDGGKTFQVVKAGLPDYIIAPNTMWGRGHPRALAVDPNDPKVVYLGIDGDAAGGKSGGGIFKSLDGGVTWAQLPNQPGSRRMFNGLAVDPTDSNRIFWATCAEGGGVWRSQDQGESWEHVFRNEIFIWNVAVAADGTIYCSGEQLWCSKDQGKTWKRLTNFPEKNRAMVGFELHPKDPNTIWVATTNWGNTCTGAVYKTTDGGETWTDITGNLPYVGPEILRFNPATNELWAGWVGLFKIKQ